MMVPTMLDNKGTKILAKSLFKELRGNGYSANQILGLTTELIDLVTQDLLIEVVHGLEKQAWMLRAQRA